MRKLISLFTAYASWLCKVFSITLESITNDRRGTCRRLRWNRFILTKTT